MKFGGTYKMNRQIAERHVHVPCYACQQRRPIQASAPLVTLETERSYLSYILVCFLLPFVIAGILSVVLMAFFDESLVPAIFAFIFDYIPFLDELDTSVQITMFWIIPLIGIVFIAVYWVTCTVYHLYLLSSITAELNIAAKGDGTRTINIVPMIFFSIITGGIFFLFWGHSMSNRLGNELYRRNIAYTFYSETFWCWKVLLNIVLFGTLVGSHIFYYRFIIAGRKIARNYNANG